MKGTKYYKIFDPNYPVHFIKTDGKEIEINVTCKFRNEVPFEISQDERFYKVEKNGKLRHFSKYCKFDATKHFKEISETEFEAKIDEFMAIIYLEKTTAQRVRCVAI